MTIHHMNAQQLAAFKLDRKASLIVRFLQWPV